MCTFTCLGSQLGQLCLSLGLLSSKKLSQLYSHFCCVPTKKNQKPQGILRLKFRTHIKSFLLYSFSQRKSKSQPILNVWLGNNICYLMGGIAKNLWLLALYTTLDREVKISDLLSVIANDKCLLECLANLYWLFPITWSLKKVKRQYILCSHEKFSTKGKTFVAIKFQNQLHYS